MSTVGDVMIGALILGDSGSKEKKKGQKIRLRASLLNTGVEVVWYEFRRGGPRRLQLLNFATGLFLSRDLFQVTEIDRNI